MTLFFSLQKFNTSYNRQATGFVCKPYPQEKERTVLGEIFWVKKFSRKFGPITSMSVGISMLVFCPQVRCHKVLICDPRDGARADADGVMRMEVD